MLFEQTMLQIESYKSELINESLIKVKIFSCYRKAMKVVQDIKEVIYSKG